MARDPEYSYRKDGGVVYQRIRRWADDANGQEVLMMDREDALPENGLEEALNARTRARDKVQTEIDQLTAERDLLQGLIDRITAAIRVLS